MFKFNIKRHQKDVIDVFLVTLLLTLNMFLQLLILHLLFDFEQVIFAEIVRYFSSFTRKQKFHRVFLKKFCKLKETPVKVCFKVLQHFSELPFCRMPVKGYPSAFRAIALENTYEQQLLEEGLQGLYIKYVGGGPEGFCGGHEIFQAYIDGQ